MRKITSVNLGAVCFQGSLDSTRGQMAAKQISQALSHPNCDIPFAISENYRDLSDYSYLGILKAKDSGKVVFKADEVLIIYYENLDKFDVRKVPNIKHVHNVYGSSLRSCLNLNDTFNKDDIIFEYDCFRNGIPSFGMNTFMAFMPMFSFNHEDGVVISESSAERMKYKSIETLFIPIYEFSTLQPIYMDAEKSYKYFPGVGGKIKDETVCATLQPKNDSNYTTNDLKQKTSNLIKSLTLSDLINLQSKKLSAFTLTPIKTRIHNGIVSGLKIHKLNDKADIIDAPLNILLTNLRKIYFEDTLLPSYEKLGNLFGQKSEYAGQIIKQHFAYTDTQFTNKKDLKDAVWVMEIEITGEDSTHLGDKLANMHANKGITSIILPDELRPIALSTNHPIDLIFNTFGVFSRMNLSQLLEGMVSKNVMLCDNHIRTNPENTISTLEWLNESIIKYFNGDIKSNKYYYDVKQFIKELSTDKDLLNRFIKDVTDNNLFIETPAFSEVRTYEMMKHSVPVMENVAISGKLIKYLSQKIGVTPNFPIKDTVVKNIFCAPMYIQKLYKIASHIISARDLGGVKSITKQPLKGRRSGGGSRIGQMEINQYSLLYMVTYIQ